MIITCPECETRFKTSADAIGPNGRTVRCANCNETWFVPAEADEMALDRLALQDIENSQNEVVAADRQSTQALKQDLSAQSKHAETRQRGPAVDSAAAAAAPWTGAPPVEAGVRGAHSDMRDRTERRRSRRRLWNVTLIWLIPLALIAAIAAGGYLYRQDIVQRMPESATLYKALGIEVTAPGLTLTPPNTRYVQVDGKPALVVEGAVKNISNEALNVPLVALTLHNSSGQQLAEWNVELETTVLEASDFAPYLTQYPAPPLDAVELRSRFANDLQSISTPVEITEPPQN